MEVNVIKMVSEDWLLSEELKKIPNIENISFETFYNDVDDPLLFAKVISVMDDGQAVKNTIFELASKLKFDLIDPMLFTDRYIKIRQYYLGDNSIEIGESRETREDISNFLKANNTTFEGSIIAENLRYKYHNNSKRYSEHRKLSTDIHLCHKLIVDYITTDNSSIRLDICLKHIIDFHILVSINLLEHIKPYDYDYNIWHVLETYNYVIQKLKNNFTL